MSTAEPEEDLDAYSNLIFVVLGVGLFYTILVTRARRNPNLNHIPASRHNQYTPSFLDVLRYLADFQQSLKKGYKNFYPRIFRISTFHGWKVLVTGSHHIEELRKAPENVISFSAAALDPRTEHHLSGHCCGGMSTGVVMGWARCLTQNLTYVLPGIREEVVASLSDSLTNSKTPSDAEWNRVKAVGFLEETVSRVVNRAFFGLNISHDVLYSQLSTASIQDTYAFSITRYIGNIMPQPLSYLISIFHPATYRSWRLRARLLSLLRDEIQKKQKLDAQQTKHVHYCQQDLLSCLLEGEFSELSERDTVPLLVELSGKSMQIIASTLLQTLRHLAASSENALLLRSEIEDIVSKEGWSGPHTLSRFRKVDSFIKETMRVDGLSALSTMRKTVTAFTFQDGTYLPPHTLLFSNTYARHHDASIYSTPGTFNGLRFSEMHEEQCRLYEDDDGSVRFGLTTASPSFLAWGYGRHACPGRFFASAVMKMILAEIVVRWDVRVEDGTPQLNDMWMGDVCFLNTDLELLVRTRPR